MREDVVGDALCARVRARGSQMHPSSVLHLDDNHIQVRRVKRVDVPRRQA